MASMDFLLLHSHVFEQEFKRIATALFDNYRLSANNILYDIVEIEFYYDSPLHVDSFIYTGTKKNLSTGNWFIHDTGIDLTFGDIESNSRGGILLRALRKFNTEEATSEYIIGSYRTLKELLNNISPLNQGGQLQLELVAKDNSTKSILTISNRRGLNKNKPGWDDKYRFIADIEKIRDSIKKNTFDNYYGEAYNSDQSESKIISI